jgi:hypothetical protein
MIAKILLSILLIAVINIGGFFRIYFLAHIRGKGFLWTMGLINLACVIVAILFIAGVVGS